MQVGEFNLDCDFLSLIETEMVLVPDAQPEVVS